MQELSLLLLEAPLLLPELLSPQQLLLAELLADSNPLLNLNKGSKSSFNTNLEDNFVNAAINLNTEVKRDNNLPPYLKHYLIPLLESPLESLVATLVITPPASPLIAPLATLVAIPRTLVYSP